MLLSKKMALFPGLIQVFPLQQAKPQWSGKNNSVRVISILRRHKKSDNYGQLWCYVAISGTVAWLCEDKYGLPALSYS